MRNWAAKFLRIHFFPRQSKKFSLFFDYVSQTVSLSGLGLGRDDGHNPEGQEEASIYIYIIPRS